jgi:hypothetical protein
MAAEVDSSLTSSPGQVKKIKRMVNTTHNVTLTNSSVNNRSRSTLNQEGGEAPDPVLKLQNKISLIDRLLGNTREGRDLKDKFF